MMGVYRDRPWYILAAESPVGWLVMDDATLRILTLAKEMAGDEQRTVFWFKHRLCCINLKRA